MPRKNASPDRQAADQAIAATRDTARNLPLPPEVANALAIVVKRNGKTLRQGVEDLAALLPLQAALEKLRDKYRAEADAELSSLFKKDPAPDEA